MLATNFHLKMQDNTNIYMYKWDDVINPKGIVQIAHGMSEHAGRYEYFAKMLNKAGFVVFANDHRGHGKTVSSTEDLGHVANYDGFYTMVDDLYEITSEIKRSYPNLPIILFGHSMGSFLVQNYIQKYRNAINYVILSGSNGKQGPLVFLGILLAKLMITFKGNRYKSKLLNNLTFGKFNNYFSPVRTEFDWLTSDSVEVDKYINDPLCGQIFSVRSFYDLFKGTQTLFYNVDKIVKNLPILIISGENDPVSNFGKGIHDLVLIYKNVGLSNIKYILYKNSRHELLNEVNKEVVITDTINWINEQLQPYSFD
ncbi:MAG: alpha/beta hydrolase family protein [Bacillales bacterium]|jgi:alpha-beta hydrolase superfamily lysophospholipase|nr:alpha/beta hydrolase family protein [Bacillales bacterium]